MIKMDSDTILMYNFFLQKHDLKLGSISVQYNTLKYPDFKKIKNTCSKHNISIKTVAGQLVTKVDNLEFYITNKGLIETQFKTNKINDISNTLIKLLKICKLGITYDCNNILISVYNCSGRGGLPYNSDLLKNNKMIKEVSNFGYNASQIQYLLGGNAIIVNNRQFDICSPLTNLIAIYNHICYGVDLHYKLWLLKILNYVPQELNYIIMDNQL